MKIISLGSIFLFLSCGFCTVSAKSVDLPFTAISSVVNQQQCFSNDDDAYQQFISQSVSDITKVSGGEKSGKKLPEFVLKKQFPQSKFDQIAAQFDCIKFVYQVDEVNVDGFYLAKKERPTQSPAVIFNRGGNGDFGANTLFYLLNNQLMLANAGYIVLASQYRQQDEFGGIDLNDVIELANIAKQMSSINKQRISMFGVSRGGMMTYMAARKIPDLKSIIVWAGVTDAAAELAFRPEMERVYKLRVPHYEQDKKAELTKRSVIHWLEDLNPAMPILLIHGDADKRVDVANANLLVEKLAQLKRPYHLSIYPDGDHGLKKDRKQAFNEIIAWLNQHG